ncbi:MAG: sigma 54-interacting transcriptional regulator [Candidatus Cloacimonetes bacterium]|nr:sigma 54-interacting transcriptional regulator [Candidatus Cloacimonadota bacterium]
MKKQNKIMQTIKKIERSIKESPGECLKLADSVSKHVNAIKDETERASFYYKLGSIFRDLSKNTKSIDFFKQASTIYERSGDKINIMQCYYSLGYCYIGENNFVEALKYFTLTLNASSEIGNTKIHTNCSSNLGRIYNELGDYDKALEMLFYSLKVFQKNNDKQNIAGALSNIGLSFTDIGLYDEAIENHLKAIEICGTLNKPLVLSSLYNNIAVTYQYSNNYEPALEYNLKSLKLSEKENDIRGITFSLNNIGEVYEKQKEYELALDYFLRAKKIADQSYEYVLPVVLFNLAKIYTKLKKYDEVLQYLNKALELTDGINVKSMKLEVYEGANEIYFELKEFQKAYEYQKKYYEIKESIVNTETAKKIEKDQTKKLNDLYLSEDFEKKEFPEIIGHSKEMKDVFALMNMVAEHNVNVMIAGPTGSGKELVAKAIHNKYKKDSPFVAINCSAIPEHLLESELFGYAKGAFTGAVKDKKGKIEMANHGTLFLDEIGDMPLSLRSKMLRVVQERTVTPVGSTKPVPVSIRIISATHRDLQEMIKNGEFRQDIYYRLNVIKIEIPALKDRRLDIPLLVNHFIRKYNKKFNKKIRSVSIDALNYLLSLSWQGNVRELENEIEKAVLFCGQDMLHIELFTDVSHKESENIFEGLPIKWLEYKSYKNGIVDKLDAAYVKELLISTGNNVQEASKNGGLERAQIYRLLKKEKT